MDRPDREYYKTSNLNSSHGVYIIYGLPDYDGIVTRVQFLWHFRWRSPLGALLQSRPGLLAFGLALLRLKVYGARLDGSVVERLDLAGCPDRVNNGGDEEHAEGHPEHSAPLKQ